MSSRQEDPVAPERSPDDLEVVTPAAGPPADAEAVEDEDPGEDPDEAPEPEGTEFVQVTRRRAPRYRSFIATGVVVAFVISGAIAVVTPPSDGYSQQALFGYLFVSLGFFFALLGGLLAVWSERRVIGSGRRPRRAGRRRGV